MKTSDFLRELDARQIRITRNGTKLHLSAAEGVITSELRAEIGTRKAEILAYLDEASGGQDTFTLRKAVRTAALPLSFAQQRLWFMNKLDSASPVYNLGVSIVVNEYVDEALLQKSLDRLVQRHEILRTIFNEDDGVPSQVITDNHPVLQVASVLDLPEAIRDQRLTEIMEAEVARPFDLALNPAFRCLLIRRTETSARLVLVVHHILADGWSLGLLVKELGDIYTAMSRGHEPELSDMQWQYADFAYSEQRWFEESDQQPHIDYWKNKLSGTISSLDLPIDHPRGRVLSSRGASHWFTIPAPLAEQLRALSRRCETTLFTTLLTVFQTLLHRYSGQDDILVGTAVANRKHVELETLIGMFVSTLVLRTDFSGDPTAREAIGRVRETVLDSHEHQDYPFEKLMDLVHMERSLAQSPMFQTAFVLHNTPLRGSYESVGSGSMFEICLYVSDGGADLPAQLEYNPDLFDADTIARMVGHFGMLANAIVADPEQRISQLPLLTEGERTQILDTWNRTDVEYPSDLCVHQLFERQVDMTPAAVALVAPLMEGEESVVEVTYSQLDRRANQLAHRLRRLGVGADSKVAIALDRSVDLVVALLAVWKAGGAYVPLDPTYPIDRLEFMIADAGIKAMVTRQSVKEMLPSVRCPVVDMDLEAASFSAKSASRLKTNQKSRNLAYVIYTSGSTGKPKGVLIEHRSLVNLLTTMQARPGLTNTDTVLSVTTLSFDIAGLEVYLPLITGGRLVLASRAEASDGARLAELIATSGATVMQATPATWRLLLESGWRGGRNAVTGARLRILCGGEALPRTLAEDIIATDAELWNMYGPTETTIWSTMHRLPTRENRETTPADDPESMHALVSIGCPIANTKLYVLDRNRLPVPVNVAGELYIAGDGLARGYHERPELTAERFVENPFVSQANARMYRTGDQTRYRVDGTVEYLGRLDNQVKIRGYRIELGEIESVLATHPRVRNAVVIAHERAVGDQRLLAYLIGTDGNSVDRLELRGWLSERLPQYMIPSAFVFVDGFPLTPNGKVDRRALLSTGTAAQQLSQSSIPPQPGLESVVAEVWRETLDVPQVWADDNFFDLGGNSLLGLRLLANLEKVVGERLPVSVLFEGQTVRTMAAALGHNSGDDPNALAVRIRVGRDHRPPLFIVPGINGNVIGYETLAQLISTDQAVYGLRSVGLHGEATPLDNVKAIAARLLEDVRKVQPEGPYHFAGFCIGGIVAYEMAQQLAASGESVGLLSLIGTWPPDSVEDKLATSKSAQKLAFLRDGVTRHLNAMREQPRGQRLAYLMKKAGIIVEMVARRDVYRGETEVLQQDWVSGINRHAAASYSPEPYSGDIVLVIPDSQSPAADRDPRLTWRNLVAGTSTVIRLPGDDSGALLRPPHAEMLADVLAKRLVAAGFLTEAL